MKTIILLWALMVAALVALSCAAPSGTGAAQGALAFTSPFESPPYRPTPTGRIPPANTPKAEPLQPRVETRSGFSVEMVPVTLTPVRSATFTQHRRQIWMMRRK